MDLTHSETLFEALCQQEGFRFRRVPRREGVRTPDYLVGPLFKRIVVEVKQLDPNAEERAQQAKFDAGGIVIFGGEPGHRVRREIDDGYPQLRAMTHGCRPGILVLYDNVHMPHIHLDPTAIKVGMYGLEQVIFARAADGWGSRFVDIKFGPKRKVGPERNRALSAVCHLYKDAADHVGLEVYHNVYAAVPLKPARLAGSTIRHHRLAVKQPGVSQEWERI